MSKLKLWNEHPTWEAAEKTWDESSKEAATLHPIKGLKTLPVMPGMTPDTAKHLKWKALKWMILKDHQRKILQGFLHHPILYGWRFLKSFFKKKSFARDGDFFYYNITSELEFKKLLDNPDNIFVVGFSYCHKPFECPSGRFTPECIHNPEHPVCQQCFIGKSMNALSDTQAITLIIPTVHYIGEKIFEIAHQNPKKQIVFLITACEMTLEMFGDWGNMVGIKGIGVRLGGRICNTMKAFELSEEGIKPGLTVVLDETQKKMLDWIRYRKCNSTQRRKEDIDAYGSG